MAEGCKQQATDSISTVVQITEDYEALVAIVVCPQHWLQGETGLVRVRAQVQVGQQSFEGIISVGAEP